MAWTHNPAVLSLNPAGGGSSHDCVIIIMFVSLSSRLCHHHDCVIIITIVIIIIIIMIVSSSSCLCHHHDCIIIIMFVSSSSSWLYHHDHLSKCSYQPDILEILLKQLYTLSPKMSTHFIWWVYLSVYQSVSVYLIHLSDCLSTFCLAVCLLFVQVDCQLGWQAGCCQTSWQTNKKSVDFIFIQINNHKNYAQSKVIIR